MCHAQSHATKDDTSSSGDAKMIQKGEEEERRTAGLNGGILPSSAPPHLPQKGEGGERKPLLFLLPPSLPPSLLFARTIGSGRRITFSP